MKLASSSKLFFGLLLALTAQQFFPGGTFGKSSGIASSPSNTTNPSHAATAAAPAMQAGPLKLIEAVKANNIKEVQSLLAIPGIKVNAKDGDNWTALHHAARNNNLAMVRLLVNNGADVNVQDNNSYTPLILATIKNNLELAQLLIDRKADVNAKDSNSYTPLIYAAWSKKPAMAQLLVDNGADVEVQDNDGSTPLLWAACKDKLAIVQLLVDKGANVNIQDNGGSTPLIWAALNGNLAMVQLLVGRGANVNAQDDNGNTPLIWAVHNNNLAIVKFLADKGADIHKQYGYGWTALRNAVNEGHLDVVRYLITRGAAYNTCDKDKRTLLDIVNPAHQGIKEFLNTIRELFVACACNDKPKVETLLNNPAIIIDACDYKGQTPLIIAVKMGCLDIVKLLVEHGANVNARTKEGKTALILVGEKALKYDGDINSAPERKMLDYLYEHGADLHAHWIDETRVEKATPDTTGSAIVTTADKL